MNAKVSIIISIISLTALFGRADRDVTIHKDSLICSIVPPANLPVETWEFSYSILEDIRYPDNLDEIPADTTRTIEAIVDNDTIYFRNMVEWSSESKSTQHDSDNISVPDAWVKAAIKGDSIIFDARQLSGRFTFEDKSYEAYLTPSLTHYAFARGNTFHSYDHISMSINSFLKLIKKLDSDHKEYWATENDPDRFHYNATWGYRGLTIMVDAEWRRSVGYFSRSSYDEPVMTTEYYGGKGLGIYANVRLRKSESGITDIKDSENAESTVYYDLHGRKYNQRPTSPGIYIHNGKKIAIK